MTGVCRGCGKPVIWIRTKQGRKMPVDAEPVDILLGGGTDTFMRADGSVVTGRRIGDAWDDDPDANVVQVFESHFARCPVGGQFRERKARNRAPGYR